LTWRINLNSLSTQQAAESLDFLRRIAKAAGVAAVVGVAACAGLDRRPPEEQVGARAQERWDALVKGDLKTAYGFLSPGSRSVMDLATYEASIRRGFWKTAKIEKVVCATQQSCEAQGTIEYELRAGRTQTPIRESWLKEGSNWWFVQK
jgi:hypothetical protein